MNLVLLIEALYIVVLVLVCFRIIYDTRSSTKTLAYLLVAIFVPFLGMIFYFSFGINYRKRKLYTKKLTEDEHLRDEIRHQIDRYFQRILDSGLLPQEHHNLTRFIRNTKGGSPSGNNHVRIYHNGEAKFPELIQALLAARRHIHIQYYIFEDDETGNAVADALILKAQQGVSVRFMYDDFGSHSLGKNFINRLRMGGVETAPFYEIRWYAFANRINYRNHRKIVVIDGEVSFMGGINISDRYRNDREGKGKRYWRDTHLRIEGPATLSLQYVFLCDWNFSNPEKIVPDQTYFPTFPLDNEIKQSLVQVISSGPDSDLPTIYYSLLEAIGSAKQRVWITSPYFIPDASLIDLLIIAAESGIDVKILVPGVSDSKIVNAVARSYYGQLLRHGVRIFRYQRGFVHAKTMVIDDSLAVVGSANMDYRSFDLNFEVNAALYSSELNKELQDAFSKDLADSVEINRDEWLSRPKMIQLGERIVHLIAPLL